MTFTTDDKKMTENLSIKGLGVKFIPTMRNSDTDWHLVITLIECKGI